MKFFRVPLCALLLSLCSAAFSQFEGHELDAPKPAAQASQDAKGIILVGEVHGTVEAPRLFGNLVTVATGEKNRRIGVGLELPARLQPLIEEAVKHNAKVVAFREQLLANPAWQTNDGRGSEAMLDLICRMLTLDESQKVSLFFFDTQIDDRNQTMAQLIGKRVREEGYEVTFILTGNVHANKASRYPGAASIVPMGYRLEEQGFAVHSYTVQYSDGEAWVCSPARPGGAVECGVHHMKGSNRTADSGAADQEGFDGSLFVGRIHASPPAHSSRPPKQAQ